MDNVDLESEFRSDFPLGQMVVNNQTAHCVKNGAETVVPANSPALTCPANGHGRHEWTDDRRGRGDVRCPRQQIVWRMGRLVGQQQARQ